MRKITGSMTGRLWSLAIVLVLGATVPTFGAWGGQLDGNQHPMVGAMYVDFNGNGQIEWFEIVCSGSYAGPSNDGSSDVFLTAAHCIWYPMSWGFSEFWVSFDSDPRDDGGAPEGLIRSTAFAMDQRFGRDLGNPYDSAVLLLPRGSAAGIVPVSLPPEGYLDDLKDTGELEHMEMEMVGYGVVPIWQQPGGPRFFFDGRRRTTFSQVKSLTQTTLRFNQNADATELGGLCFKDSGSPQFVPGTNMIVSTTIGGDYICRANNWNYRLDTPGAREFLAQFLELP